MNGHFTSGERRGALILAALIVIAAMVAITLHGHIFAPAPTVVQLPEAAAPAAKGTGTKQKESRNKNNNNERRNRRRKPAKKPSTDNSPAPRSPLDETVGRGR